MKTVKLTIAIVLLLMSLMFVSCAESKSGKRETIKSQYRRTIVQRVGTDVREIRPLDTMYLVGDTIALEYSIGNTSYTNTGKYVVVR